MGDEEEKLFIYEITGGVIAKSVGNWRAGK